MSKIKIMSENLANKIAAGEVVEKCASVVKELVENAIDAKANNIKINLEDGGLRKIEIIDNGIGMDKEDAVLAFARHATSKIYKDDDLFFIETLGFRGEALASIASVSEVNLETCSKDIGTHVHIKGGKMDLVEPSNARIGTSICVTNLFYNTPARLKYLKSEATELNNCIQFIEKLALSKPDIAFTLTNNDKVIVKTSGKNNLLKTIHEIYGLTVSSNMLSINKTSDDFEISGYDNAAQRAANAVKIEDRLAEFSWSSVQNRDYTKQYNPMSTEQICKRWNGFDFATFFQVLGIPAQEKIIVQQPSFFDGFSKLFASASLDELKDYMAAGLLSSAAGSLSDEYYDASFDFFSTQMNGVTEKKPSWKRAMSVPNGILGEAVGQMYVKKYFPEEYKQKVLDLVRQLQVSLGQHIDSLAWMSDSTKAYAREKLDAFTVKIGYPDKWKDYSTLNIDPELSYFENLRAASAWYVADNLSKLGQPTDPDEWGMTPQTVNAYYNPTTNEICFPAAILQPPFFNADADDAVNYGAIGVVIGHEMTHGFDDQGRLFDKEGNMTNWWTPEDEAAFKERTAILEKQYSEVEILPGIHADGALTLGENIADHGGISIAWTALHNALGGVEPEPIDGFTAAQRFFIGYAHLWADNATDEAKARLNKIDVHSLAEERVNVAVRNFPFFFEAFGIKEGDKMWRPEEERVSIW